MKKFIAAAIIIAIVVLSWDTKCDHVYAAVEQPEITLQHGTVSIALIAEDKPRELICVKCLHEQNQVVKIIPREDHWDIPRNSQWPFPISNDTIKEVRVTQEFFQRKAKEARDLTNKQLQK